MDTNHSLNSFLHEQCQRLNASACESVGGEITSYSIQTMSMSTLNPRHRYSPERSTDGEIFQSLSQNPCCITQILYLSCFFPYFIHSCIQQLPQTRGKIISSKKLALTANNLTDYEVHILQNPSLDADRK